MATSIEPRLPPPTASPLRVLFTGRNTAASWTIRAQQIAACRTSWRATHRAEDAELRDCDVMCVVKRPDAELVRRARRHDVPVVFDVLDSWAQPADGLACRDRQAAVALFREKWTPFAYDGVIFPNRTMREHLGALAVASTFIYHHFVPGLEVNAWREEARTVGYVGSDRYLGPWEAVLARVCDELGLKFVANPPSFAQIDIGVCVRGGEHDNFLANTYKSNVKLANFYGAGVPALAGVKERSCHETDTGFVHFFADEPQLRSQLARLLDPSRRRDVRERFVEARDAFRIERMAEAYESFFQEVVHRHRLRGARPLAEPPPPPVKHWAVRLPERIRKLPRYVRWIRQLPEQNRTLQQRIDDAQVQRDDARSRYEELKARHIALKLELEEERARADELRVREETDVISRFHQVFYDRGTWKQGLWAGVPILKNPLDLFLYQELIFRRRPRFIVELGANQGGSTLFFANMLDLLGADGQVISVSIDDAWAEATRSHPRVTTFAGSSTDPAIVREVVRRVGSGGGCLVNLDSDHRMEHVLAELRAYGDLPGPGDYLIVEDGNVNGRPVRPEHGPGPAEAVEAFLASDDRYELDADLEERYLVTFAVKGFLRRRAP